MTAVMSAVGRTDAPSETIEFSWRPLYRMGGVAALVTVVFIPIAIVVFMTWPPPKTVIDWFSLFENNRLVALIDFDVLILASNALSILVMLALYVALRRVNPSFMAVALALGLVGTATYFASNPVLSMLSLSSQYAAATTDVQRATILAAGQAMLAIYQGTAFWLSNALGTVALLIIAVIMLRSNIFGRATAYVGIVANVVGLGLFIPSPVGIFLSIVGVIGLAIWNVLIARRLFHLGQQSLQE